MQLDTITLPDDLLWVNEFDWNPVEQNLDRSLTGALMVQEQALSFGRPIVLSGGQDAGWVSRDTIKSLLALSQIANKEMILILPDLRQYVVIFDRQIGNPIEAQQVMPCAYPSDDDQYSLILRLLTTEPTA